MHRIQLTLPPAQVKALLSLITPFFPPPADETKNPKQKQPKIAPTLPTSQLPREGPHPYLPRPIQMPGPHLAAPGAYHHSATQSARQEVGPTYFHRPLMPTQLQPPSVRPSVMPVPGTLPPWRHEVAWIQPGTFQSKEDPAVAKSIVLTPADTIALAAPPAAPHTPRRDEPSLISFDTPEAIASAARYLPLAPDNVVEQPRIQPIQPVQPSAEEEPIMVAIQSISALYALEVADVQKLLMQTIMEPGFVSFVSFDVEARH